MRFLHYLTSFKVQINLDFTGSTTDLFFFIGLTLVDFFMLTRSNLLLDLNGVSFRSRNLSCNLIEDEFNVLLLLNFGNIVNISFL